MSISPFFSITRILLSIPSFICVRPSMSMHPISPSSLSRPIFFLNPIFSLSPPSGSSTHPYGCEHADPAASPLLSQSKVMEIKMGGDA
ncbi:hypothetical protein C1H46_039615 [Malus baccata]|uniref:Uncharacterized protein n=1 Tax=Malus baccata TaxID=106549 RepID=A0A540KKX6_MALBA|nr:hypothetical protein C1H46_039615 [Malus baccata]